MGLEYVDNRCRQLRAKRECQKPKVGTEEESVKLLLFGQSEWEEGVLVP